MRRQFRVLVFLCLLFLFIYYEQTFFSGNYPNAIEMLDPLGRHSKTEMKLPSSLTRIQTSSNMSVQEEMHKNGNQRLASPQMQMSSQSVQKKTTTTTESYSKSFKRQYDEDRRKKEEKQRKKDEERRNIEEFLLEREAVYRHRTDRINRRCQAYRKNWRIWKDIEMTDPPNDVHLYVNFQRNMLWSEVPKAASTSWKHYFGKLRNNPKKLAEENEYVNVLKRDRKKLLDFWNSSVKNGYISFMFTRHPFARILSAYRSKLEGNHLGSVYDIFHNVYGKAIVLRYRFKELKLSMKRESCTFSEFVSYLLDVMELNEPHWRPITLLTYPCELNYTVVAQVETFEEDTKYLFEKVGAGEKYSEQWKNQSNVTREQEYYSQISSTDLMRLYKRYKTDFQLFGYDPEEYLKYTKA